jgi:hypothetical protein
MIKRLTIITIPKQKYSILYFLLVFSELQLYTPPFPQGYEWINNVNRVNVNEAE